MESDQLETTGEDPITYETDNQQSVSSYGLSILSWGGHTSSRCERTVVTPENCCNRPGCNPTRNEALPLGPEPPKAITTPRINS